jgi:hypothetical protein
MASEVSICNQALAHIGAEAEIESLTESTEEAKYCNIYYAHARDHLLRSHAWNFATKYVTLAQIGTAPSGWTYQYQYPSDCLNALEIVNTNSEDILEFEVISDSASGKYIVTDVQDAELRYTSAITDPNVFDLGFIEVLTWAVAYRIAEPITGNTNKKGEALTIYQNTLKSTTATDSGEGRNDPALDATWIEARL